jgi:hypothetical protein
LIQTGAKSVFFGSDGMLVCLAWAFGFASRTGSVTLLHPVVYLDIEGLIGDESIEQ